MEHLPSLNARGFSSHSWSWGNFPAYPSQQVWRIPLLLDSASLALPSLMSSQTCSDPWHNPGSIPIFLSLSASLQLRQIPHLLPPMCWDTTSSRLGKPWPPDPNKMIFFFAVVLSCWFPEGSTSPQHSQTPDDFIPIAWLSTAKLLFHSPKPPLVMKHKNHGMLDVYLISFPRRRSLII